MAVFRQPWNYATQRKRQQSAALSSVAPAFSVGPIALNLLITGYDVQMTMSKNCTISILVASSQPSDAAFDASSETVVASAGVPATVHHTG